MLKSKKMKVFGFIVILLLTNINLWAQKKYEMTAAQAVDFALKNVTDIKNLVIDRQIQDAKNKEITGQALPQVSASVSLSHYFSIPVTLLPDFISPAVYDVLIDQGVKDGNGVPIVKPTNDAQFFPARFGVPWQATAGITFQQLLFQPDVFVGLQARGAALKYAENNVKVMEDSVKSNVYRAYYSVLIAEKRLGFIKDGVKRLEKLAYDQEQMYKNGFAEKLDIEKTQVSLNNLTTTKTQLENLITLGYASLKFSMGLNQADTLLLKDLLSMEDVKKDILQATGFRYEDRNEIKVLNTVKELQRLDLKRNQISYIPTVSAFWNYNRQALRQQFDFFNFNKEWFASSVMGFNINVPLFSGLQKVHKIRQARLNLEKTSNTIENIQRLIDFQREAALSQFKNALSSLDVQERNLELAERVYNTTKKKFEQGLGSSFEILQAEGSLEDAQANLFQALYDAIVARIGYYRSLGKL
jgi:outer membrane protein